MSPDIVAQSFESGRQSLLHRTEKQRKESGQFLTPPPVAAFVAQLLGDIQNGDHILDPAAGSGTLSCAVIERLVSEKKPLEVWLDAYEIDPELCQTANINLNRAVEYAAANNIVVHLNIVQADFIEAAIPNLAPLFTADQSFASYQQVIANPPYFKLHASDWRAKAASAHLKGHTNIYTLFMALAVKFLAPSGQACFLVPRSFCSSAYFSAFRRELIGQAVPTHVHLFESRQDTFRQDAVLQENVIFSFQKRSAIPENDETVLVSASKNDDDLHMQSRHRVSLKSFIARPETASFFRLPVNEFDEQIVETVDRWLGSLTDFGLGVSTGPVVPFRARDLLTHSSDNSVPLLWMHNVRFQRVLWPLPAKNKAPWISVTPASANLLVNAENYVLVRRFSAKEESRRLTAAPFIASDFPYAQIGLENHLNFIYKKRGHLEAELTIGLSAFLNSELADRYFRILNGNTQINALELELMPLPPLPVIEEIGRRLLNVSDGTSHLDTCVMARLAETACLSPDFPLLHETPIPWEK